MHIANHPRFNVWTAEKTQWICSEKRWRADEMPRRLRYCLLQTVITQHPRANPTQARKLKTNRERGGIHQAWGRSCNFSPAGSRPTYSTVILRGGHASAGARKSGQGLPLEEQSENRGLKGTVHPQNQNLQIKTHVTSLLWKINVDLICII